MIINYHKIGYYILSFITCYTIYVGGKLMFLQAPSDILIVMMSLMLLSFVILTKYKQIFLPMEN